MKRISIITITFLFLNAIATSATVAADQAQIDTPQQLAEHFCRLDYDGARLRADTYDSAGIGKFIIPGKYGSPGWDQSVIVSSYKVGKTTRNADEATVMVKYDVVGVVYQDLVQKKESQLYTFHFKRQNKRWFMVEPYDLPQHISTNAAIKHWEYLLSIQGEAAPNTKTLISKLKKLDLTINKSRREGR